MNIEQQYDAGDMAAVYASNSSSHEGDDLGRAFLRDEVGTLNRSCRLLDIGCGSGIDLRAYSAMGFVQLFGVDPSGTFLQEAERVLGTSATLSSGTFEQLPFADASMDVITSRHALHYVADIARAVSECARVLVPGGVLIVVMSHPFADGLLPRDEAGNVTPTLFGESVSITYPGHALGDIFSDIFFSAFTLARIYEYTGSERDGAVPGIPNTLAFVATKK